MVNEPHLSGVILDTLETFLDGAPALEEAKVAKLEMTGRHVDVLDNGQLWVHMKGIRTTIEGVEHVVNKTYLVNVSLINQSEAD